LAAINAVKKLGAQVKLNKNNCTIIGNGKRLQIQKKYNN
jgi:5-enolpyruvylshikimate-3-phosphate synthase